MNLEMTWARAKCGYRIEEIRQTPAELAVPGADPDNDGWWIVRSGNEFEPTFPLATDRIYRVFAQTKPTPASVLAFVSEWGMPHSKHGKEVSVKGFVAEAQAMRNAIRLMKTENWQRLEQTFRPSERDDFWGMGLARTRARLRFSGAAARPTLVLEPLTLREAMWLQLARDCHTGAKLAECIRCGLWFEHGSGTGRRETARYCSPKCKDADAYARRKAAGR